MQEKNLPTTNFLSPIEGLLLVNKTLGQSSFSIVKLLRKVLNVKKIGHAGTLDPFASGLMILLVGKRYTRLSSSFLQQKKEYRARLCLGYTTNTYDSEAEKKIVPHTPPSFEDIQKVLKQFEGDIQQIPPMFSAKKINGKKLYQLARKGIEIERQPIKVWVHIDDKISYHYPYLDMTIYCSSGTYIRSLAHDIGKTLSTGAYLHQLTRIKIGDYSLEEAVDQKDIFSLGKSITKHLKLL